MTEPAKLAAFLRWLKGRGGFCTRRELGIYDAGPTRDLVAELIEAGLVEITRRKPLAGGRPISIYRLTADGFRHLTPDPNPRPCS